MKTNWSETVADKPTGPHLFCTGQRRTRTTIREMGLIPGTLFTVIGRAPLRDPVALRLLDFTLTLRNNEADHILVVPLPELPKPDHERERE